MFQAVDISDDILAEPPVRAAVENATRVLAQTIGSSARLLKVGWTRVSGDRGGPFVRLSLEDWTGRVEGVFSPKDLVEDESLRARFYRLYGDLLQIRSHRQLDALITGGPTETGP